MERRLKLPQPQLLANLKSVDLMVVRCHIVAAAAAAIVAVCAAADGEGLTEPAAAADPPAVDDREASEAESATLPDEEDREIDLPGYHLDRTARNLPIVEAEGWTLTTGFVVNDFDHLGVSGEMDPKAAEGLRQFAEKEGLEAQAQFTFVHQTPAALDLVVVRTMVFETEQAAEAWHDDKHPAPFAEETVPLEDDGALRLHSVPGRSTSVGISGPVYVIASQLAGKAGAHERILKELIAALRAGDASDSAEEAGEPSDAAESVEPAPDEATEKAPETDGQRTDGDDAP